MKLSSLFLLSICSFITVTSYATNIVIDNDKPKLCLAPLQRHHHQVDVVNTEETDNIDTRLNKENPVFGFTNLEFLYWRGQDNNWYYGNDILDGTFVPNSSVMLKGKTVKGTPSWKPGCRITLGFANLYDWMIDAMWTYYHNSASSHNNHANQFNHYGENVSYSHTKFRLNYNIGDLELTTNYPMFKTVNLSPIIGVRGAFIKNKRYFNSSGLNELIPIDYLTSLKTSYTAFGPRAGIKALYKFNRTGLDIFGVISTSLLYGKNRLKQEFIKNENTLITDHLQWSDSAHDLNISTQLIAGLDWKYLFNHDKAAFSLYAAWEVNYWASIIKDLVFNTSSSLGVSFTSQSLILYGINIGLGFEY
jgi:hypothetical protein